MSAFEALGVPENEQIEHKMLSSAIEKAQMKIEGNNFGIRKNLLEFDRVNNDQREIIYAERRKVLDGENMRESVMQMIDDTVEGSVNLVVGETGASPEEWDLQELNDYLRPIIPLPVITKDYVAGQSKNSLVEKLNRDAKALYKAKEEELTAAGADVREIERVVLLRSVDRHWMTHIDDMDQLRQGIGLAAYGQKDPKVQYKMEGYDMFNAMTAAIQEDTLKMMYHVRVEEKVEREEVAKVTGTNRDDTAVRAPKKRQAKKVYPNDPCPCGSGLKYKQCHGRKGA
jgi:preprotein translocase subunit SecA